MPTQWSEAEQAPLGCIAPYATAPLAPLRRGGRLCPPAIIRTHPRCSSVGGDALIAPYATAAPWHQTSPCEAAFQSLPLRGRCQTRRFCRRESRLRITFLPCHSEPVTDVTGMGIRAPRRTPPPHSNSFNFFSTKSSQNPLPAFKFFQGNYRFFQPFRSIS